MSKEARDPKPRNSNDEKPVTDVETNNKGAKKLGGQHFTGEYLPPGRSPERVIYPDLILSPPNFESWLLCCSAEAFPSSKLSDFRASSFFRFSSFVIRHRLSPTFPNAL